MADTVHQGRRSEAADPSVAELLKQLSEQTSTLVRQELELAKIELESKGKKAGLGAGMFGAAGLFGLFALATLTACAVLALDTAMAGWLAALIVAVVYGAVAGGLALSGKAKVTEAVPPVPEQTVDSVKEDVKWTKQHAKAPHQ
ncbi:MAG: phage holin family protein [Actinomycetota bacterium]|nr:phage holin family protein [Actinomycetota bacterium]